MDTPYNDQPDSDLELLAARGDGDAFAELYNRHSPRTYDFVIRIVRDGDEAADIVQDTFLKAMKALKPGQHGASFSTWIFTIARNLCLTKISKRLRTSARGLGGRDLSEEAADDPMLHVVDADRFVNPAEAAQASDLSELVWSAAGFLNPKEASILDLHLRQDLDSAEIAEVLGVSKGNAYTILSRLKSTFEEAVVALTMVRSGRKECAQLDALLASEDSSLLSPAVRRLINGHVKECAACQELRSRLLSPTALFGSFALVPIPIATKSRIAEAISAQWLAIGPAASAGSGAGSSVTQQISTWTGRAGKIVGEQIRNVAVSWPYQTVFWKATYLGVALVTTAGIVGGGVAVTATRDNSATAVAGASETPRPTGSPSSSQGDSAGNTTNATPEPDTDGDGLTASQGDCDDANPAVRPGRTDIPNNSVDENCDGRDATELEPDRDGDAIPDASDDCPDKPENFDGYKDLDGCPEEKPATPTQRASPQNPGPSDGGTPTLTRTPTPTPTPPPTPTPSPTPSLTPTPSPSVSLSIGSYSASPGGSVTVRLALHAAGLAVGAYTIEVAYDTGAVDATACAPAGQCNPDFSVGVARVTGVSAQGIGGDVTLAEITFQVLGTASTPLDIRIIQLKGPPPGVVDLTPIATVTDGSINVAP